MDIFENKQTAPWLHYTFNNLLPTGILKELSEFPVNEFNNGEGNSEDFKLESINVGNEIKNETDYNYFDIVIHNIKDKKIINLFRDKNLISKVQEKLNINLSNKVVEAELVELKNTYKPEIHLDKSDKIITVLVYLKTDKIEESGTWLYDENKNLHSKLDGRPNSGILFINAPKTWHSVPIMEEGKEFIRRSLLITYRHLPRLTYKELIKYRKNIFLIP
tara:strand:+ start:911 stop:1567 length:657 start_codon:yes stop_codon:yes gene_type:complete